LFTVQLNAAGEFGPMPSTVKRDGWRFDVRTNNGPLGNNFTILSPRQFLAPTPQATFAMNASNAANASVAASVADGSVTSSKLAPAPWPGAASLEFQRDSSMG